MAKAIGDVLRVREPCDQTAPRLSEQPGITTLLRDDGENGLARREVVISLSRDDVTAGPRDRLEQHEHVGAGHPGQRVAPRQVPEIAYLIGQAQAFDVAHKLPQAADYVEAGCRSKVRVAAGEPQSLEQEARLADSTLQPPRIEKYALTARDVAQRLWPIAGKAVQNRDHSPRQSRTRLVAHLSHGQRTRVDNSARRGDA